MICKYAEIFCWKNVSSFCSAKATHIFSAKNIRILYIEFAKTVNEMTLNVLVKLTTLWTTGPRKLKPLYMYNNKNDCNGARWGTFSSNKEVFKCGSRMISEEVGVGDSIMIKLYLLYIFGKTGLSKQWRSRREAAECSIWSGSTLCHLSSNFTYIHR